MPFIGLVGHLMVPASNAFTQAPLFDGGRLDLNCHEPEKKLSLFVSFSSERRWNVIPATEHAPISPHITGRYRVPLFGMYNQRNENAQGLFREAMWKMIFSSDSMADNFNNFYFQVLRKKSEICSTVLVRVMNSGLRFNFHMLGTF